MNNQFEITLPNGCTLYRVDNAIGCHTYYSDECGAPHVVWDVAITDASTLIAAINEENKFQHKENYEARQNKDGIELRSTNKPINETRKT